MVQSSVIIVALCVVQAAWGSVINQNVGVIGGNAIRIEDAPFMSLLYTSEEKPCGGAIIDREFILTADTCCNDARVPVSQWKARVAASDEHAQSDNRIKITEFYKYKKVDIDYNLKPHLCIVKLAEPLRFGPKINKISLEEPDQVLVAGTLANFTAFGWPALEGGSRILRRTQLPISDIDWCKKDSKRMDQGLICAGDHTHNACIGDAGGALTYGNSLIGVLSEVTSDCKSHPSRFSRISHYRPWINATMAAHL